MIRNLRMIALLGTAFAALPVCSTAMASDAEQAQIKALEARMAVMQAALDSLTQELHGHASAPAPAVSDAAPRATPVGDTAPAPLKLAKSGEATRRGVLETKPGKAATFYTAGGEVTAYGNFDVSVDVTTKGLHRLTAPDGSRPVGNVGWLTDISSNMSYVGLKGFQPIAGGALRLVYQFETQIDISSSSGTAETNSNQSNVVKGGLTSRNTFIGIETPHYGTFLVGKTDAPYKQSTQRLNPFVAMIGDYAAIMGNSGGDNRVEFGTRLDHALWYQSPKVDGFEVNALFSPGQNRASNSDNIAAGESDCTGGNVPGSGGSLPTACNDGAFSDAVSASVAYTHGPLYVTVAYERHNKVNRASDLTGYYAAVPAGFMEADVADEDAAKIGVQYVLPTRTTVGAVYESLHRYVPSALQFQNERQRTGYWVSLTQQVTAKDSLALGWAHADRTPGDPGQHNTSLAQPPLGQPGDAVGGAHVDNSADMLSLAYKRVLGGGLSAYVDVAGIHNGPYAHYALGAGGRSVTTDCHDASDASGGLASNPHCWAGGHIMGVSSGLKFQF